VVDPYVYPGTSVLRNLADLRDADTLAARESQVSTLRLAQLSAQRLDGVYDLRHLQGFHSFIFQDLYPWAGELRSTPLAKPGSMFALPELIESYANEMFSQLAREGYLRGLPRDQFADRLTHYYAEINAVHPFRDGNGRAQRAFLRQLALDASHTLAWERLDPKALIYASQRSFQGEDLPMRDLLGRVLDPPDR
jgi:cell filamentation protein